MLNLDGLFDGFTFVHMYYIKPGPKEHSFENNRKPL